MAANGHRVISFEPVPQTFRALASGFAANNFDPGVTITLVNAAASTERGVAEIRTAKKNAGHSITGGVNKSTTVAKNDPAFFTFAIETTTLDSIVHEPVDLMKIDTQGHELKALRGAHRLLSTKMVRTIYFEFDPLLMLAGGEEDPAALLRLLDSYGYRIEGYPNKTSVVQPSAFDALVARTKQGWLLPNKYRVKWLDLIARVRS